MMKLDDREWRPFDFTDVFDIRKGFYNKKPNAEVGGKLPFLGATANNNGVTAWYSIENIKRSSKTGNLPNEPLERKVFPGGGIVITNNGSVGHAYYWSSRFTCSHDINPIYLKDGQLIDKNLAMFLISIIEKQAVCFEYARKWRPKLMVKSRIMLPVDSEGKPDYEFMREYAQEMLISKKKQYQQYVDKRLSELGCTKVDQKDDLQVLMDSQEWKPFYVVTVFPDNERGKRLKKADQKPGNIPYASSTSDNNGIDGFIKANKGTRVFKDCISLANSGSVGSAFYEPFAFVASDHVTHLKKDGMSKYQYLFLSCLLKQQSRNYNFNREINDTRLKKMQIMLPITDNGEPDYDFMEDFGRKMMAKKYHQYLEYLDAICD